MNETILRTANEKEKLMEAEMKRDHVNANLAKTMSLPYYPGREADVLELKEVRARLDERILAMRRKIA